MALQLDPNQYDACPEYNIWLDEQYVSQHREPLDILTYQPRPSEVLFTMSPDTYQALFADFVQQRNDEIREAVWELFPSPIAYYFYRFENGYESDLQRLHFLRDTWESTIDILHALAVAELRHHRVTPVSIGEFKSILTDKVNTRLQNIEHILNMLSTAGVVSITAQIVSIPTLRAMKELNQSRNAFSHSAAQSELQARNWIAECFEDVLDVLSALSQFRNIQIVRYLSQAGLTLRCEPFRGYGSTKTIRNITITSQQMLSSAQYLQPGQVIVITRDSIVSLRPLICYREDNAGHTTRLCLFRKTYNDGSNRRIEYEVVGEAARHSEDRTNFAAELTELRALFGLEPD